MRHLLVLIIAFVALLASAPKAAAGDTDTDAALAHESEPWAEDISDTEQKAAGLLYNSGNEQFKAARHAKALVLYADALKHWNHPRIRINAAAACLELDRLLDAASHLKAAQEYRDDLTDDDRAKMDAITSAIDSGTGVIKIRTQQAGAIITVNGEQVLVGPGSTLHRVVPGKHVVVAQRKGLETETQQLEVAAGDSVDATPILYVVSTDWRWAKWKPWAVVGLGAVVVAAGAPILLNARSLRKEREELELGCIDDIPRCAEGGDLFPRLGELDSRADTRTVVANSVFIVGGAVMATGLVLAILNRPSRTKRIADDDDFSTSVWIDEGLVGGQVSFRF